MDSALAVQIGTLDTALRATLDSLEAHSGDGSDTGNLVKHARELSDELKAIVGHLDDEDDSEGARRNAAYLEMRLAVLEKAPLPSPAH